MGRFTLILCTLTTVSSLSPVAGSCPRAL
jgi:hypothetical protein